MDNKVSRNSSKNIQHHDDNILRYICRLGYDGYYMRRLNNNGRYIFHSEVGLCKNVLNSLVLEELNNKRGEYAPRLNGKNKTKKNIHTNKNISNITTKLSF
jgi:hypothetical protein